MIKSNYQKRCLFVVVGSILIGLGISLALKSMLGADALSLLYSGCMQRFSISFGQANIVCSLLFLLPVWLLDKSHIGMGTIVSPLIIATVTDLCAPIEIMIPGIHVKVLLLFVGLTLLAIGASIYVAANLGKASYDACCFILIKRFKMPLMKVRCSADLILCVIAISLGASLSLGPLVSVLLIGTMMQITLSLLQQRGLVF